jgi:hypothetical protein
MSTAKSCTAVDNQKAVVRGVPRWAGQVEQPSNGGLTRTEGRSRDSKQNLGHPVNDLSDLGTTVQTEQTRVQSVEVKPSTLVEMASRQGIERRNGGSDHDQPVCDPTQLALSERTDLVEVRKGHHPHHMTAKT